MRQPSILLTKIQRFSLHDGPGIRTTVFLKGCSLRCPWCCNPENLSSEPQTYMKDGAEGLYGKWYKPDELVEECLKDKNFYDGRTDKPGKTNTKQPDDYPGGVTFSGGEPLLQIRALLPVIQALHKEGVHVAVETCLFVPETNLQMAIDCIDYFHVDMKSLSQSFSFMDEYRDTETYLKNLDTLMMSGKPVVIRIPVIGAYTAGVENRKAVKELLGKYRTKCLKVELIKEHDLGATKYRSLNMPIPDYRGVSEELMESYRKELSDLEIPIEICKV